MTTSKTGLIVLAALCLALPARAQQALTLADATARALERNTDIRIERELVSAAEAREAGALGNYDFRLKIDASERHHRDPITTLFSGAPPGEVAGIADAGRDRAAAMGPGTLGGAGRFRGRSRRCT